MGCSLGQEGGHARLTVLDARRERAVGRANGANGTNGRRSDLPSIVLKTVLFEGGLMDRKRTDFR